MLVPNHLRSHYCSQISNDFQITSVKHAQITHALHITSGKQSAIIYAFQMASGKHEQITYICPTDPLGSNLNRSPGPSDHLEQTFLGHLCPTAHLVQTPFFFFGSPRADIPRPRMSFRSPRADSKGNVYVQQTLCSVVNDDSKTQASIGQEEAHTGTLHLFSSSLMAHVSFHIFIGKDGCKYAPQCLTSKLLKMFVLAGGAGGKCSAYQTPYVHTQSFRTNYKVFFWFKR